MIESILDVHVRTLCTLARGDAEALIYPLPEFIFGFHAQQAFEKSMKALIAAHSETYPKTHRLDELKKLLALCGEGLPSLPFDLLQLQTFAVEMRYDEGETISSEQRALIQQAVLGFNQHVVARILELQAPSKAMHSASEL